MYHEFENIRGTPASALREDELIIQTLWQHMQATCLHIDSNISNGYYYYYYYYY